MKTIRWYALAAFGLLFSTVFWHEKLGLNFVIFTWLSLLFMHFSFQAKWSINRIFLLIMHGLSSFALLYVHSGFAIVMSLITYVLAIGSSQQSEAKSPLLSLVSAMDGLFYLPVHQEDYGDGFFGKGIGKFFHRIYKYRMVAFLFGIFLLLFFLANMAFQELFIDIMSEVFSFLEYFFVNWNMERIMFTLLGLMLAMWFIFAGTNRPYILWEKAQSEFLVRIRKTYQTRVYFSPVKLLISKKSFHYSFVALNLLLLLINALDVAYVWFKSDFSCRECLSKDVHFGVEVLIFSILLASALVLVAFRGNLNFIRNNKGLRHAAVVWIAQNLFLLISVTIRNSYYVGMHGLTYKRIGVFIFLTLVAIGLYSLLKKVIQVRSLYYVARLNAFAWIAVLVLASNVNWDRVIFSYNTTKLELMNTDYYYLLSLSDEIQPDLYQVLTKSGFHLSEETMISYRPEAHYQYDKGLLLEKCYRRLRDFQDRDHGSWLSFNGRDYRIAKKLRVKK